MAVSNAFWDQRYSAEGFHFGTEPNGFLKAQAGLFRPGQKVLMVADGEGRNGVFVASLGARVHSIDGSAVAVDKARAFAKSRGVALEAEFADLAEWAWPEAAYDVVVAIFIQFADPAFRHRIFEGMKRATRPGGLVVIEGYRPEQIGYGTGGPPQVENLYTLGLLEVAFSGYEVLHAREHDSVIQEGRGHGGMSALVDFVARKPA